MADAYSKIQQAADIASFLPPLSPSTAKEEKEKWKNNIFISAS
jgi:hypothetical protein